ncbi:MAG: phenylalanine--tRNA ligase subunit beta [Acidobacteria bacterium]|nr:phenylalanine--tRNA ligase subunit beta [Acidobacteriota bacterium]
MKILVSWLREFVDPGVPIEELGWRLHMAGFELASIDPVGGTASADEDAVVDLEITANRPDCLSVAGIAREAATLFDRPLTLPTPTLRGEPTTPLPLSVTVDAAELCGRYAAAMADVRIGPSPAWLERRLAAAGVRAINNIVDVSNYVLLEMGHPTHAFDYARLGGAAIVVRRARAGERVTTLDGQERTLEPEMLVIADAGRAQAVAGVMGGLDSEVSLATTTIVLESAWFLPTSVRRTGKRLGLSTEASYRFERGADPDAPVRALARCCELIEQIGAGAVRPGWIDAHPAPRARTTLTLRGSRVAAVLGAAIAPGEIERVLGGLGFDLSSSPAAGDASVWHVTVPSWRGDVAREIDLIEEVARVHGYDRLPTTFPSLVTAPAPPDARLARDGVARRLARALGFHEAMTFTFVERDAALPYVADAASLVPIANPLSEKFAVLRPSLLAGLVDSVAYNRRREQRDVRLFETGSRFASDGGESRGIALAWTGAGAAEHWSGSGRPVDFFDLKGAVEVICDGLGLAARFEEAVVSWLVHGRAASAIVSGRDGGEIVFGRLGQLAPAAAAARGLPAHDEVYVAELDLDAVADLVSFGEDVRVRPLPRFPSVVRDLSLVVAEGLPAEALRATIRQAAPPTLEHAREFARYRGRGVPDGQVSLSFRLTFRAADRTLTDAEVQSATDEIVAALQRAHDARLR